MYWFAKKQDGEIIELTEREALMMTENNNVARRMRLQWIGTSTGQHQEAGKAKIHDIIKNGRTPDYFQKTDEDKALHDHNTRLEHRDEINAIRKEAYDKELEEAKSTGFIPPRKELHIHTPQGNRDKLVKEVSSM